MMFKLQRDFLIVHMLKNTNKNKKFIHNSKYFEIIDFNKTYYYVPRP